MKFTIPPRPPSTTFQQVWYLFLRDTTSSLVLGAGHYMSDRHNTPLSYSQETGYSYHILRRHQSGAC